MSGPSLLRLADAVRLPDCLSTQDVCRRLAAAGAPEGTIVVADAQSGGRGRESRRWHSPSGAGLYTSFLLRPRLDPSQWIAVTPLVALALAEALESLRGPAVEVGGSRRLLIKWPNDVCGRHGKLAGILAETEEGGVVVGLGLNLSQERPDFPAEIRDRASSLRLEGYDPVPGREAVLRALDLALGRAYRRLHEGDAGFLRRGLLDRFSLEGRHVRVGRSGGAVVEGIARGIGDCGELILETADGPRTVVSGEVVRVGPPAA